MSIILVRIKILIIIKFMSCDISVKINHFSKNPVSGGRPPKESKFNIKVYVK